MSIELLYLEEHCQDCHECEDEFRRHVGGLQGVDTPMTKEIQLVKTPGPELKRGLVKWQQTI